MKHLFFKSFFAASLLAVIGITADAAPRPNFDRSTPWQRVRKVIPPHQWSSPSSSFAGRQTVSPDHSLPQSDSFQYIYSPDGSIWYATCSYETVEEELYGGYATQSVITGFTYTIYDSSFNEIGSIHDDIALQEDELRCAQVMLDVNVSKKFFNYDDKYELMVTFWMNKADYSMNVRTNVYSIGGSKTDGNDVAIDVIPGYPADAVNLATQSWDEYFYITFLTEEQGDPDDYNDYLDYLATYKEVLTTYTKATFSSEGKASVLYEHKIPIMNLPGDQMSCPMMFMKNADGVLTLVYQQYEQSFFIDPTGMGGNEDITPDNNLVIDVYQLADSYSKELTHVSNTKIASTPVDKDGTLYTFYGIGNLLYEGDIDFSNYSTDGSPCFIVSIDEYLLADDDNYNSSYYVYDVNGNRIKTLSEDTYNYVLMTDIPGYEPQAVFVHTGDEWTFEFVNLYSAETVAYVDQMFRGYGLSTSIDRVPTKDGYMYAVATTNGVVESDEDGSETNVYAPVVWLDMDGDLVRIDQIPVGSGVELVRFYIASEALSPYVFNTDSDIEYMLLVKRRTEDGSALQEEFLVATTEKGAIHTFLPDSEKGVISMVYLLTDDTPQLIIAYVDNYKYVSDSYALPFTKFDGGTGAASNPYLIATAGDLLQIKSAPKASYRLVADIDCGGVTLPTVDEFSGTLDGDGHTVSNITVYSSGKAAFFNDCSKATIKNINFYNYNLHLSGSSEAAVIAYMSLGGTFDNIHIRRLNVDGDSFSGSFSPIVARAWTGTNISECEVSGASIVLPSAAGVSGIVGDMRTGSSVSASAFSGSITAANNVGGIVVSTTTGDETITNCHVDADLKAQHSIGGIVAFLDRSKVTKCYVEGTLEATNPSKWTKSLSVGGIAGELEGDWQGSSNVPVTQNLIGLSAIITPDMSEVVEDYDHQLATVHRVVGRTSYNTELDEDELQNGPIYETGVLNNLVISDLAVIDPDFNEQTIEGTSIDKYEVTTDLLESQLGFSYGNNVEAPWNIQSWYAYDPALYYENSIIIPNASLEVEEDETFDIEIDILSRTPLTADDVLGGFMCEFSEDLMEMTGGMDFDGNTLKIEFKALKEGVANFSTSILDGSATCTINIVKKATDIPEYVESIDSTDSLKLVSCILTASGCSITVYDMQGCVIAAGYETLDTSALAAGIYVAVAKSAGSNSCILKFIK